MMPRLVILYSYSQVRVKVLEAKTRLNLGGYAICFDLDDGIRLPSTTGITSKEATDSLYTTRKHES